MDQIRFVRVFVIIACLAAFAGSGCRQLFPYDKAPSYSVQCYGDVFLRQDLAPAPGISFSYSGSGKASEVPDVVRFGSSLEPVPLYRWGRRVEDYAPWRIESTLPSVLRGTWLVRVDADDFEVAGPLMRLEFGEPDLIDDVWLAWDTRGVEPSWVTQSFEPMGNDPDDEIQSTQRTTTGDPVRFRIWRLKDDVDLAQSLELGGNADPSATWPNNGRPGAQYLVLVRRTPVPDLNGLRVMLGKQRFESCGSLERVVADISNVGLASAFSQWTESHPEWSWAVASDLLTIEPSPSSCEYVQGHGQIKECQDEWGVQTFASSTLVNDWRVESVASVDPTDSSGEVGLDGDEPVGTNLEGSVSFRVFDDGRLILDELSLYAGSFSSGGIPVHGASFGHRKAVEALCQGQAFPHSLCDGYLVEEGALELFASARVGEVIYPTVVSNEQPIEIEVDLNQRIFRLEGGPFTGEVALEDGSGIQVEASFRLTGRFDNFAPVASADEGDGLFACMDNGVGRVRLDAGKSWDAEGALVDHQWVLDAGASTQSLLGAGDVVEVELPVGEHEVTLLVEDTDGVRSHHTRTVAVVDDVLDSAVFPTNVWATLSGVPQGGTWVNIGSAAGSDTCAPSTWVIGNAPDDRIFPDGLTLVEWQVDDGHGNVARDLQTVLVVPPGASPPPEAWVSAPGLVAGDGTLTIDYGTNPRWFGVTADVYVVITRYDGTRWSFNRRGGLSGPDEIEPRARRVVLGVTPTSSWVALDSPIERFEEEGPYAVEHMLVLPNGNPLDPTQLIGWDGMGFTLVR